MTQRALQTGFWIGVLVLLGCSKQAQQPAASAPKVFIGKTHPSFTPPLAPPDAPPRIVAMGITADTIHSGDHVSGWAVTSSNVAGITVRVQGYALPMQRVTYGQFIMNADIPKLPSFVKRDYDLVVQAATASGDQVSTSIPIHVK